MISRNSPGSFNCRLFILGACKVGNYDYCVSVTQVIGYWRSLTGSNPHDGPLEPILIYVEQNSIRESFMKAVSERAKVLKARDILEKEIYDSLNLTKYKFNNSKFDLELLNGRINSIIERSF
ncbi:hypothetical protein [Sedimentibacter sp.]|uniref:hypothetical protein n=1 Tax=Sedimentibacter sp. TaxID=1960295 RepID=UPI0028AD624D|nr:hypothetical protein [Sedimentibacter sp.]